MGGTSSKVKLEDIDVPNVLALLLFYALTLFVGIWAGRRATRRGDSEELIVANRNMSLSLGIFSLTASWVGGEYIVGTAAIVFSSGKGLIWAQAALGDAMSLVFGGLLFAKEMRSNGYVTVLDPFQYKYGEKMCCLLFVPALLGELFWTASVFSALGATLNVILRMEGTLSIVLSAVFALGYTMFGGIYSVAYTDVVQLCCIFFGLWIAVPFAMTNPLVKPISTTALIRVTNGTEQAGWIGRVALQDSLSYVDDMIMLCFGSIPLQSYFQRVLSARSARNAQILSFASAFGCLLMAVPAVLLGAVAASADWQRTAYFNETNSESFKKENSEMILPLVLQYLCPPAITFVCLGVISAAVMSSVDSSILSAGSLFACNVMKPIFWQTATDRQVIWAMRAAIVAVAAISSLLAIGINEIDSLWLLSSDLVYTVLFPQLIAVIYISWSNTYGSLAGYIVGMFLRISAGEARIHLPALIRYPGFVDKNKAGYQRFPAKSFAMLISLATLSGVSYITHRLFNDKKLPPSWDVFRCVKTTETPTSAEGAGEAQVDTQQQQQLRRKQQQKTGRLSPVRYPAGLPTPGESHSTSPRQQRQSSNAESGQRQVGRLGLLNVDHGEYSGAD